jgi:RNA polymerase sigma-70 factor (ECF subfamily)
MCSPGKNPSQCLKDRLITHAAPIPKKLSQIDKSGIFFLILLEIDLSRFIALPMITDNRIQYLQYQIAHFDDQQAYKELFISLYTYLFPFARTLVKAKEPAEEIVSDVFIKVWEKRKELDRIENLKVYLYVSTRNIALNYLHKQKRIATHSIEEYTVDLSSVYFNPEELLITADMLALIQKAIDQLPPKCKMIFKLIKEDGLRYKEVAEVLNISVKTVENQLAIALNKIGNVVSFDIRKTISSPMRHHL